MAPWYPRLAAGASQAVSSGMRSLLTRAIGATLATLLASACYTGQERELRATTLAVASQLGSPRFWLFAADSEQMGGTLVSALIAGLPQRQHGVGLEWGEARTPWTVVVREQSAGVFVVEGYGAELGKPLYSERAVRPPPMKLP